MGSHHEPWVAAEEPASTAAAALPDERPLARPVHIWGTAVWPQGLAVDLISGGEVPFDGTGILVTVRPVATAAGRLDPLALARRICACVNFCAGAEPEGSLGEVLAALELERQGASRDVINRLWRPGGRP